MNETRMLADFVAGLSYKDLDGKTIDNAKLCIADAVGVAIAGSKAPSSKIIEKVLKEDSRSGNSVLFNESFESVDASSAAGINAAYIHSQDFDDLHNSSIVHAGAITIPTAFALGTALGKSAKDIILAIVKGYEVAARCGESINPSAYYYWHTTGVVGALSSAATAASILGLDGETTAQAFGSAGTQAAGLWAFLKDGTMSKLLHVANANICGIRSAKLAKEGFTGATDILENPKGFVSALSKAPNLDLITKDFGKPLKINTNSFKPYACCRHTHSACYGIYDIKKKYDIKAADIEKIEDYTYQTAVTLNDNPNPSNSYAAKFSLQYCIAASFVYDNLQNGSFSEEKYANEELRALMSKITVKLSSEIEAAIQADSNKWGHRLVLTLKDGRVIDELYQYPFGDFNNPFTWEDMRNKYMLLAAPVIGKEKAGIIFEKIQNFDNLESADSLFR